MSRTVSSELALRIALVVFAAAFVGAVAYAVYTPPEHVVVAGDPAPTFSVRAEDGRGVSVPGFGGKLLVLNFWASWCPPCIEETPSLSKFAEDYASRGVVVMAISVDANEAAYRNFLRKYQPRFLTTRESQIHRAYGTFVYPESYLIDATGKVVYKIAEGADWNNPNLRALVESKL